MAYHTGLALSFLACFAHAEKRRAGTCPWSKPCAHLTEFPEN